MRIILSVLIPLLLAISIPAHALVIGTLDFTRTNAYLVQAGSSPYSIFRDTLTGQGHTFNAGTATGSITSTYLSGIDVFLTSVFNPPPFAPTPAVIASEAQALHDWVFAGGNVIFSGEHNGFVPAFNPYTQLFGITMAGISSNYNNPPVFITSLTDPYLANSVSGAALPVNNRGYIASVTNPHTVLATFNGLPNAELFAISMQYGQGTVVAFADTYFMNNLAGANNVGQRFLTNALNVITARAAANEEEEQGGQVPEPTTLLLVGLGLLGLTRIRSSALIAASSQGLRFAGKVNHAAPQRLT